MGAQEARVELNSLQVLTFRLAEENYGVDILRVKEIRGWSPVTVVPESAPHVLGVLNLRGCIVPVLDLRSRFKMESVRPTPLTVIIVLAAQTSAGLREYGLVVDSVSEVVQFQPGQLRDAPSLSDNGRSAYFKGLAEHQNALVMLLAVDQLI